MVIIGQILHLSMLTLFTYLWIFISIVLRIPGYTSFSILKRLHTFYFVHTQYILTDYVHTLYTRNTKIFPSNKTLFFLQKGLLDIQITLRLMLELNFVVRTLSNLFFLTKPSKNPRSYWFFYTTFLITLSRTGYSIIS